MKPFAFRSRKACDYVQRKGNVWKGKMMTVRWLPGLPRKEHVVLKPGIYLGTFASAKLEKSAVKRNRMRRRCREAFRLCLQKEQNLGSAQLLVSPKIASLDAPFPLIEADVQAFLTLLPHSSWQNPKEPPASSITQ